ncbi:MAG TPA: hypothetical protein VKG43_09615 [Acidimicrobiales bacterium]|nr:hypothetical protein [Acidimicrobiales bacterium]
MSDPEVARPRVLYVCAWGRSGTTVLDRVFGQVPGFVSVGELRSLWDADPTVRRCGCGVTVAECALWGQVLPAVLGPPGPGRVGEVRALRDAVGRTRHLASLWRLGPRRRLDPAQEAYRSFLVALYRALLAAAPGHVVVDSSKHPAEALLLSAAGDVEVSVLHLVRDPRAVAYSWSRRPGDGAAAPDGDRPPPRGPLSSSGWWTLWNATAEGPLRRRLGPRYRRLRYEDVMADPEAELGGVLEWMGERRDALAFCAPRSVDLGRAHTVAGNPNRFGAGPVTLREDRAWEQAMDPTRRTLATLGALPLMAHYGYRLSGLSAARPGAATGRASENGRD